MPDWIITLLKDNGAAGAIIFVLCSVVMILCEVIRRMYNHANKVYGYRLAERDTLRDALRDNTAVLELINKVTEQRNSVTQELADSIKDHAASLERLRERLEFQHDAIKDELNRSNVSQLTAANIYAKTLDDIRNFLLTNGRARR